MGTKPVHNHDFDPGCTEFVVDGRLIGGCLDYPDVSAREIEMRDYAAAVPTAHDPVETPLHYRWHPSGVECIDIAAAFDYSLGNVIKYVWRCDYKGKPVEDLKKAATYLQRAIEERE